MRIPPRGPRPTTRVVVRTGVLLLNLQIRFVVDQRSDADFQSISVPVQSAHDRAVFQQQTLQFRVIPPGDCHDGGCALVEMRLIRFDCAQLAGVNPLGNRRSRRRGCGFGAALQNHGYHREYDPDREEQYHEP